MGQITKNQEAFLQKRGVATQGMSFEQASQMIGGLKGQAPGQSTAQVKDWSSNKPSNPRFDSQSAYVSYCKDLCIAMLNAHVEARKIDSKIEPIAVAGLMDAAADAVRRAKNAFA